MPLDDGALRRGCGDDAVVTGRQLCRVELDRFKQLVASGAPLTVGCTQEAPLFTEVAGAAADGLAFVNLRESGGWSSEAAAAGPKMAALAAAASLAMPATPFVRLDSEGVILIYGRDEQAIEAAELVEDHLDVTVMITPPADVMPRRTTDFPIVRGTIRSAKGQLGGFEIVVDDYALPLPSSRASLAFGEARAGAVSRADILLDLSGGTPLFPASELRDGYLRADPGDPPGLLRAVLKARDLVGTFDKPRYITFTADLCAHSRSRIVGCHRCLDLCPTSAIQPAGDHVAIDEKICAGCGQCAAACPTGAASYALPPADLLMQKLRLLLSTYAKAGGTRPILLLHDEQHGGPMIDALARHGDGLPANVLPVAVNEVTQIGLEAIAASFAYGTAALRILLRGKSRHDVTGLLSTLTLSETILAGLGFAGTPIATIETDDPFALGDALRAIEGVAPVAKPASFLPMGDKRGVLRLALAELQRVAPAPVETIALPAGAPFGAIEVDAAGCTLCLSCVTACPTGALSDDPERPVLRFAEEACIQCGLCKATCPEKVVSLVPRLAFASAPPRLLKQEEPFHCIRCDKPFGVKSTIERVLAKLADKHWMYQGKGKRLDLIKMCEDCRVIAATEAGFDPYGAPPRPAPRTTDDYLREREKKDS